MLFNALQMHGIVLASYSTYQHLLSHYALPFVAWRCNLQGLNTKPCSSGVSGVLRVSASINRLNMIKYDKIL
jgi:hypothetical protein